MKLDTFSINVQHYSQNDTQNCIFGPKGVGHFKRKFQLEGDNAHQALSVSEN